MSAESAVLSVRSEDGRSFVVENAAASPFPAGSLIVVSCAGRRQLGLVEERTATVPVGLRGRLIGELTDDGIDTRASHAFDGGEIGPADRDTVAALHHTTGAELEVGVSLSAPGGPARLLPTRFNRHTFWCGQSGSGKTYALGVVLEQLIAYTALPIVIFDPNSDFVRIGEVIPGATGPTAQALRQRDIRVLRPKSEPPGRLRAKFIDMPLTSKAAVLQLDPVADREEFNELIHLASAMSGEIHDVLDNLRAVENTARRRLAMRVENLGLLDWEVWAGADQAVTEIVADRPDVTVLDLGGFSTPAQQLVVALSLLDDLWGQARGTPPGSAGDRRSAQPRLTPTRIAGGRRGARAVDPDRRRGAQIRPVVAAVDTAAVKGAPRHHLSVRQPRLDEDDLPLRPGGTRHLLRLRAERPARPGALVPAG
ncbi:helicase HerA domain-containing protein [Nocardia sp. NPDC055165]